ncbi:PP0621 family protein [Marinomonas mediterranea]|jgi:hypothetical protein|uniref:TRASH domain-containing protein n=1 Tax=Marinomonas mediterranea (strain ATCC 700492 / JCM 21426 / NBRC 103028 / MMB-1) TaxID=717774 RepID=F2K2B2_MARM1|nr:PP0621 family protein [Marinomonas mediterranea]ADZ92292.1 hypothetical protein Marme_3073 [Marinomonas mediterranea MMB-1]WCN18343.1 hypothetical protein GV053_15540 [Marinomonas mediterranea MMB-1]
MIVRLILFLLIFFIGWTIYRQVSQYLSKQKTRNAKNSQSKPGEKMTPCAHCGTYVPESESIKDTQGNRFCSQGHLKQFQKG